MGFHRGLTIAGLAALFCAAALLSGCGSSGESTGSTGGETESSEEVAFTAKPKGGVPGALLPNELELWKYNSDTGKYDVVAGDASKPYEPTIKQFPAGTKLGYIDPWAANPFAIPIREGFEALGKKYGFEIVYCDAGLKPDKAVACAEEIAPQEPQFVVAGNWLEGAAPAMMKVLDEARIPASAIDVAAPNAIFVGTNNYAAGLAAGKAGGEFAKEEWDCDEVWLLLGENVAEGQAPDLRLQGFTDGVQDVCGSIPDDQVERVLMAAATSDQALTATTDWLTAHPQAKHVLATSLDDERASGIAKSFVQATETEAFAVGMGCDTVGIEVVKQAQPEQNHFLGCTAFFPEKYPELLVSVAQSVLDEVPVPSEVHVTSEFLDHANIDEFYGE